MVEATGWSLVVETGHRSPHHAGATSIIMGARDACILLRMVAKALAAAALGVKRKRPGRLGIRAAGEGRSVALKSLRVARL